MVEFIGIIKVKVIRGTKLAVRDILSSDPYVVLTLGQQVCLSPNGVMSPIFLSGLITELLMCRKQRLK
jgi:hypothetical protein